ncbi:MAG: ABC transporter permease [Candidatus Zixiibacteriota bacterium]
MMAFASVKANKFRSFLTILGVLVGVGAVVSMASVIDGLNLAADEEIDRIGSNIIMVHKFGHNVDFDDLSDEERNRPPITEGEARAILENCPTVTGVAPHNYYFRPGGNEAKYKNRKYTSLNFNGTWPDFVRVRTKDMSSGRFIVENDLQFRRMVCVIGSEVAEGLFSDEEPVGRMIRVNGDEFEVVGVFKKVESNFGNSFENKLVSIPLTTFSKLVPWEKELSLDVSARSYQEIEKAKEEIIAALRIYRKVPFDKPNNFALLTQDQFKEQAEQITDVIYIVMIVITSVGLMVGGIGVMNIMLVSVTERTREIGVRKAIGAKKSNIILQFLTEAMSLSGFGGVIGVIVGVILGLVLNNAFGFPTTLPFTWVVIGFVVSVSVGLASGVYPAVKAARLDPIEALRYE